uniref:Uncharacterized protein n=1 Tax=Plectus sambesii TaxID=2011161 RepID=A0A914WHF6_9BILA
MALGDAVGDDLGALKDVNAVGDRLVAEAHSSALFFVDPLPVRALCSVRRNLSPRRSSSFTTTVVVPLRTCIHATSCKSPSRLPAESAIRLPTLSTASPLPSALLASSSSLRFVRL